MVAGIWSKIITDIWKIITMQEQNQIPRFCISLRLTMMKAGRFSSLKKMANGKLIIIKWLTALPCSAAVVIQVGVGGARKFKGNFVVFFQVISVPMIYFRIRKLSNILDKVSL